MTTLIPACQWLHRISSLFSPFLPSRKSPPNLAPLSLVAADIDYYELHMLVSEAREVYIAKKDEEDEDGDIRRNLKFIKDKVMERWLMGLRRAIVFYSLQFPS